MLLPCCKSRNNTSCFKRSLFWFKRPSKTVHGFLQAVNLALRNLEQIWHHGRAYLVGWHLGPGSAGDAAAPTAPHRTCPRHCHHRLRQARRAGTARRGDGGCAAPRHAQRLAASDQVVSASRRCYPALHARPQRRRQASCRRSKAGQSGAPRHPASSPAGAPQAAGARRHCSCPGLHHQTPSPAHPACHRRPSRPLWPPLPLLFCRCRWPSSARQ